MRPSAKSGKKPANAISIHAPRAGCDITHQRPAPPWVQFQSTHPVRGATRRRLRALLRSTHNFNPRTPCGVRPATASCCGFGRIISIHAPRAGCDNLRYIVIFRAIRFQSTHPVRGATRHRQLLRVWSNNFNPRTPCGVRQSAIHCNFPGYKISIHAPRAGCDAPCFRPSR